MHFCPICGSEVHTSPRYPRAVCRQCVKCAVGSSGEGLEFRQSDPTGEFEALYVSTGILHPGHDCWIDGRPCRADVARFGGIVVEAL